jgi:ribosomal protein S20
MKKILLSTAVVGTLLFTGCAQQGPTPDEQVYVDPELQGAPSWVMMPVVEGTISEVGSAKRNAGNDIGFQRNEAMADARDNLARQIETKVSNMFKSFKAATGSGEDATFDQSVESVSKQIASQTLKGTVQKNAWISKTGTMYVLVAIDTQAVADMMEKSVKTSFKNDKALYQKFLASKAQGELEAELEKLNR